MREILFKAKRLDNGEWVEGYLVKYPSAIQVGDCSPWYIQVPPVDPDDSGGKYNVDPSTVCEYTGLTDKNGKKVFVGDIIKCSKGCPHEVVWLQEYGGTFIGGMPAIYLSDLMPGYAWTGAEEIIATSTTGRADSERVQTASP